MKVITISGYAEAGKDTVANEIKWQIIDEKFDARIAIIHFADLLKWLCRQLYGWNGEKDEEGRELLQHVGTDVVRAQEPDFWVDIMTNILRVFSNEFDYVLIPDCRFVNEADVIKAHFDSMAVRVNRPNHVNHLTPEQRLHPSETSMDNYEFDYIINNPGTVEGLEDNVAEFIQKCLL